MKKHHFRMANQINPCSSVIASNLGTALHALQRSDEALAIMEKAIKADEKNPVPMYQKANILMSLEKFDEALAVLEELNEYSPCESSVHALMGRIYKRRNMHDKAMLHFGIALDLKPSTTDVTAIKAAIEVFEMLLCIAHQVFDKMPDTILVSQNVGVSPRLCLV